MADGKDIKAINADSIVDIKFNLDVQEQFANDKGVVFEHYAAIPSPIGLKDRGDYRRPETLDTISEGGYIYKKMGEFVGTLLGNSLDYSFGQGAEGGIYDASMGRLVLPRKYSVSCTDVDFISLLPGDRVYAKDIELKVPNTQRAEYNPNGQDYLQYPVKDVVYLQDSRGKEYKCGTDFKITKDGNIDWINGGNNPGTDPDTGKGRVYSIRYSYVAFWYIERLLNEIRITNSSDSKSPERLPYHAVVQREYVYRNKNRGEPPDTNPKTITERTTEKPKEVGPSLDNYQIKVDIKNFE